MCAGPVDSPDLLERERHGATNEAPTDRGHDEAAPDLPRDVPVAALGRRDETLPEAGRREGRDILDWLTFGASLLTLIAVTVYASLAYTTAVANEKAAAAAEAASRRAADTYVAAHRAWVLIDELRMRPALRPKAAGSFVSEVGGNVTIRLKNFGQGPARRVRFSTRLYCPPVGEPCPDPGTIVPHEGSEVVMGPDHGVSSSTVFVWKNDVARHETLVRTNVARVDCLYDEVVPVDPARVPTHRLFAATRITYLDQFGESHWTHSCGVWNRTQSTWDVATNGNDFN